MESQNFNEYCYDNYERAWNTRLWSIEDTEESDGVYTYANGLPIRHEINNGAYYGVSLDEIYELEKKFEGKFQRL